MNITTPLFIAFVLGMTGVVIGVVWNASGKRGAIRMLVAILAWFTYVVLLNHLGVLQKTSARPPGVLFLLLPLVAYIMAAVFAVVSSWGARLATAIPFSLLIGLQAFRIGVELFIHALYMDGVVPRILTFGGANIDIYVGILAIPVAVVAARYRFGKRIALAWNVLGLLALANVVTFAIVTAPGPLNFIHAEPPNRMFVTFPFMFIPAFFVPLAVTLHLLSIRALAVP